MRKYSFVLAAVAVTGLTVAAKAAESNYWFDTRPNSAAGTLGSITSPGQPPAVPNPYIVGQGDFPDDGGNPTVLTNGRGNGQVLRVSPVTASGAHIGTSFPDFDADGNASTGNLWLYCDVNANTDAPAGTSDVISSIGLDASISTSVATPRFEIGSVLWSWTLTDATVPVNYGFAAGTSSAAVAGPRGVTGAKYVKVPVSGASTYATAGGLVVGGPYQLGKIAIGGAARNSQGCGTAATTHANNSTYTVSLSVNNLLVTRTFSSGGDAVPVENISLGYFGGGLDGTASGNVSPTPLANNPNRDAIIQVRMKHDGNGSGNVNNLDISGANGFNTAAGLGTGINQRQRYLFDRNNNGNVNNLDISGTNGFNATAADVCTP